MDPYSVMKKILYIACFFVTLANADERALLFYGNCVTCHHETESISAPSMEKVRRFYKNGFENRDDFIKYMSEFVIQPRVDNALMVEMVEKYQLMPLLGYEKDVVTDIVSYIYDTDFTP